MRRNKNTAPVPRGSQPRAVWLLVCLLPYLFFALLGEGLHTDHLPNGSIGVRTAGAVVTHVTPVHFAPATMDEHSASDVECLACQWSSHSIAVLPLLQPQIAPFIEIARVSESPTVSWTSRATASALGRGPPTI